MVSIKELKEYLYIKNGELYWKKYAGQRAIKDSEAGSYDKHSGYSKIKFRGKHYLVHRIIWALHYGVWPSKDLDHINGFKADNRIENLREVTHQQNCVNRPKNCNNTSGFKGVIYCKASGKYRARIGIDGNRVCLGYYTTPEQASRIYEQTADEWFGTYRRR